MGKLYVSLALKMPGKGHWVEDTDSFWYGKTMEGGYAFVLVDAAKGTCGSASNHAKLAVAYNKARGDDVKLLKVPFEEFGYGEDRKNIEFAADGLHWKYSLDSYVCKNNGKDVQWWQEPQ